MERQLKERPAAEVVKEVRVEVPVLNPRLVAFKQCETLIDLGIAQSKTTYFPPETAKDDLLDPVASLFP